MKKVLVIFGGVSSEHDVSTVSASNVIDNIPCKSYEVYSIGITKDGEWYLYEGKSSLLPNDKWVESGKCTKAIISPDRADGGILVFRKSGIEKIKIDAVFPVLHGKNGEDGAIQGFLELAGIPFVGCDMLSSACSMDKAITNTLADDAKISQAKWRAIDEYNYKKSQKEFVDEAIEYLGFPIFVKPANAGSSVGITKAKDKKELINGIDVAFSCDRKIVLEEFIDGVEVECAVIGNNEPMASVVGEIIPENDFYDYESKYESSISKLYIPARLSLEKQNEVRTAAVAAFTALSCSGLSRVDFFVRKSDGEVIFNEINTIPGFTEISMYPKLMEQSGVPYPKLLDRLFKLAIARKE
ncbi:MAG: D-alanine--D-alanine ligase family protein [Oscillospiraceae bacterium]